MSARRRAPRTQLRDLAERQSIERLAERFDRTPRTIERWLAQGPPASVRDDVAEAYERSERARLAVEERERQRAEEERRKEERRQRRTELAEERRREAEREARRRARAAREAAREAEREAARQRRRELREAREAEARRVFEERSRRAKRGWGRRRMRDARVTIGPHETGRTATGHHLLRGLLGDPKNGIEPDPVWLDFLERCQELGFTAGEARDEWFSPELIG